MQEGLIEPRIIDGSQFRQECIAHLFYRRNT
jgi:hypothetical protein